MVSGQPARALQAVLVLCCVISSSASEDAKKKKKGGDDEFKVLPMPHHSFSTPLEYKSLLDDWVLSGASLFERDRMMVHPGVPALTGFAWNKQKMLTDNFQATIQMRVVGDQARPMPSDQSFAFWYIDENVAETFNETQSIRSNSWEEGLAAQDMGFVGSKSRFEGFGVVFSAKGNNPTVSFVYNDGTKVMSPLTDVPSKDMKEFDFRNTMNPAQVQIRVKKRRVTCSVKQSQSLAWQEAFSVEVPVKRGGHIGFSAWSGKEMGGPALVSIVGLEVSNFDETSIGEEMKDVSSQIQDAYKEMLMDDKRHFADQKSQTEHMQRLITMLNEHLEVVGPAEQGILGNLQALGGRMNDLGKDCGTLAEEARILLTNKKGPQQNHAQHVEAMKNDIIGLRKLLAKDSTAHRATLDAVSKNVAEVKQKAAAQANGGQALVMISQQSETLEKSVLSRGSQMTWMMFCLLLSIVAIGGLMWNRMQYYEKKHFI